MSRSDITDPFALPADPELHDLFVAWARKIALATRTITVGTVQAFNPNTQSVTVTVDMLEIARAAGATTVPRPPLLLPSVPVHIYGDGLGVNYFSTPILPGSTGMLLVSDRSLATWLERKAPVPVDPVEWFTHRFANAIFIPGLSDNLHKISLPIPLDGPVVEGPVIHLGRESVLSAAIAETLIAAVDAMLAAGAASVGVPADPSGENAGVAFAAAQVAWEALKEQIKAQKVKVF